MAIEDIFRALDKQAEEDCQALLAHARAQAERIVEDAQAEGERVVEERIRQVQRDLGILKNQRLNSARLDGKKRASAERERLVQEAFEQARADIATAREREGYNEVFMRLLTEAAEGITGIHMVLHVDPRDEELARSAAKKLGLDAELAFDLDTAGGVRITMADGKVARQNTLESRLGKARRVMKSDVAAALFEA